MDYSKIPGIDKPVSRLVQGTLMVSAPDGSPGFELFDAVFERGCTTFDTAHVYGNGTNERLVGQWVRERGIRDQVVIIGKGAHHNEDRKRVTPFDITADIHDSLARFRFDYIDLYLLHRDDPSVPVGPIVEVLNEQVRAGHIHAFGGSNWSHARIQAANEYAAAHGLLPFVASSPNVSLARQDVPPWDDCISISNDNEARAWYTGNQMPVFAWSSLAGGFFSGRFRPDNLASFDNYFDLLVVKSYCTADNFERLARARQVAEQHGLTLAQVALAYVMSLPLNTYALVGCYSGAEFQANMDALAQRLPSNVLAWMNLETDAL